jgi:hypothetical protein
MLTKCAQNSFSNIGYISKINDKSTVEFSASLRSMAAAAKAKAMLVI